MAQAESAVSRWLDCPDGCGERMPEWAHRAMWEHMDTHHRDIDPEAPWVERASRTCVVDSDDLAWALKYMSVDGAFTRAVKDRLHDAVGGAGDE